jgi:hypothetical protein
MQSIQQKNSYLNKYHFKIIFKLVFFSGSILVLQPLSHNQTMNVVSIYTFKYMLWFVKI